MVNGATAEEQAPVEHCETSPGFKKKAGWCRALLSAARRQARAEPC